MTENTQELIELEEDDMQGKYLTFSLDKEFFGIEIKHVTEIIGIQPITELPEMPGYIKGIINLRGKIIPVLDIRIRFKMKAVEYNDRTCIIVVDIQGIAVGLIIDAVSEVIAIDDQNIVPPPALNNKTNSKYIKAIGKVGNEVKLLLDCEKLLNDDELAKLNGVA